MSEPDAGSDLAGLKTSAVRDGDEFVVNGQKIWTSFGDVADYCYLICRTDSSGPPHKGISEIIVPMDTPGIEVRPITDMTTNRHFCEVYFTDVRVPVENLVGSRATPSSRPWCSSPTSRAASTVSCRTGPCSIMRSPWPTPPTRWSARRSPVSKLSTAPAVSSSTARCSSRRLKFSAATKAFCTEHEVRVADFASRVLGASALVESEWTKGLLYAPGYTIMGGTSTSCATSSASESSGFLRTSLEKAAHMEIGIFSGAAGAQGYDVGQRRASRGRGWVPHLLGAPNRWTPKP
ncbi:MAG: acyl-CoA dehydrogenase family protein [Acidimicrobiales bacterium]